MPEKEIIDFCLTLDNTFEDRPFPDDFETVAYHMNKQQWNTIIVSEKVDSILVKELLQESYKLTKSKNSNSKVKKNNKYVLKY